MRNQVQQNSVIPWLGGLTLLFAAGDGAHLIAGFSCGEWLEAAVVENATRAAGLS